METIPSGTDQIQLSSCVSVQIQPLETEAEPS